MNNQKLNNLLSDEQFVKKLFSLETSKEVQDLLVENDVDMTIAEIEKIKETLGKQANGTLSDEELENIAGGKSTIFRIELINHPTDIFGGSDDQPRW